MKIILLHCMCNCKINKCLYIFSTKMWKEENHITIPDVFNI